MFVIVSDICSTSLSVSNWSFILITAEMGNVQVLAQNSNNGDLTEFQKNKLLFDFNTFFDLNNDGFLSFKVS